MLTSRVLLALWLLAVFVAAGLLLRALARASNAPPRDGETAGQYRRRTGRWPRVPGRDGPVFVPLAWVWSEPHRAWGHPARPSPFPGTVKDSEL